MSLVPISNLSLEAVPLSQLAGFQAEMVVLFVFIILRLFPTVFQSYRRAVS
jgi:hypothetical protein